MAGFLSHWRKRQRQKHMLDGPGMARTPDAPPGQMYYCTKCGHRSATPDGFPTQCPACGLQMEQVKKELDL